MKSRVFKSYNFSLPRKRNVVYSGTNACSLYRPYHIQMKYNPNFRPKIIERSRYAVNARSTISSDTSSSKDVELKDQNRSQKTGKSSIALKTIQKALGSASSPYTVHGMAEILFKECARHAAYKTPLIGTDEDIPKTEDGEEIGITDVEGISWHKEFGFPATFSTWSQVSMLHMYIIIVRVRNSPPNQVKLWQQCIQDQFFFAAEDRMVTNHKIQSGVLRSKYLKDLYVQWRGLIAAYDEGLVKGDAVLAAALWRNLFKAKENIDIRHLAQIVSYMRHSLQNLDELISISHLLDFKFGNICEEKAGVMLPSKLLGEPF